MPFPCIISIQKESFNDWYPIHWAMSCPVPYRFKESIMIGIQSMGPWHSLCHIKPRKVLWLASNPWEAVHASLRSLSKRLVEQCLGEERCKSKVLDPWVLWAWRFVDTSEGTTRTCKREITCLTSHTRLRVINLALRNKTLKDYTMKPFTK